MTSTLLPGAPFLAYRESQLFIEDMCLQDLANTHGTPLFVYSKAAMLHALAAYQRAFAGRDAKVHYAMKANSSLGVLQVFAHAGCGFDIVSAGELARVLAAGGHAADVIFSGVGKTREEMRVALQAGIACFNVESEAELDVLNQVAVSVGKVAPVSIRVNPNVDPKTHPYISTGLKGNKFGIAHERTLQAYQHAAQLPGLKVVGIDCHIGSQITTSEPYMDALDKVLDLVEQIEKAGIPIHHLDFGGGLGINYNNDTPPAADSLWSALLAVVPIALAVLVAMKVPQLEWVVVGGLGLFGFAFAVNSSVHSYLILAYAGSEKAAEDVGFYYAANALGRFIGTLLSGLLYQWGGLLFSLSGSAAMLVTCWLITLALPDKLALRAPHAVPVRPAVRP